jgi:hypothetical protein
MPSFGVGQQASLKVVESLDEHIVNIQKFSL